MAVPSEKSFKRIASNRKALRDYSVLDRFEAGIELYGTEVKSLREAQVNLTGSYASVDDGQVFVHNVNIKPYEFGNRFNHEAARPRRLLLHRREIVLLRRQAEQKGRMPRQASGGQARDDPQADGRPGSGTSHAARQLAIARPCVFSRATAEWC
jgi:hypothetical protein